MSNVFRGLALLLLLTASCEEAKQPAVPADEKKLVREAFAGYKSAILNDKGEEAVKHLDSRTLKYYGDLAELTRTADSAKVNSLGLIDKLMVLTIRHRATREEILAFDGNSLLVYAIKNGMVGKNSVLNNTIGDVTVDQAFAKGVVVISGKPSPISMHFYKEEGNWKADITSLFPSSEIAFRQVIAESGQDENAFFFSVLEAISGSPVRPSVWHAVK
jgi:hypothetical protein